MPNARGVFPTLEYAESAVAACQGAHVVLHLTEWPEFAELDPAALAEIVAAPVVLDGRNCLDAEAWRAAGWTYRGLGRP
jgi:UDPglucose 6-dehydrogenase